MLGRGGQCQMCFATYAPPGEFHCVLCFSMLARRADGLAHFPPPNSLSTELRTALVSELVSKRHAFIPLIYFQARTTTAATRPSTGLLLCQPFCTRQERAGDAYARTWRPVSKLLRDVSCTATRIRMRLLASTWQGGYAEQAPACGAAPDLSMLYPHFLSACMPIVGKARAIVSHYRIFNTLS